MYALYATLLLLTSLSIGLRTDAGQAYEGLADTIRREIKELSHIPKGRYTAVRFWEAEGRELAHMIGRAVSDPQASGERAWEVRLGSSASSQTLVYGPYVDLPPGDYVAFFRLKLMEEAGEERVADIDAATAYGQNILRVRELEGSSLTPGRYVEVPLSFRYPGGKLECRVFWSGYAALRVDRIALYRVEGAPLQIPVERARQPVPSGSPNHLTYLPIPRPFPDIFPRSAEPASHLYVFDLRSLPPDGQLMILSLQGLVNRDRPRLYCLYNPTDVEWLAWMKKRRWVRNTETITKPEALISRFRRHFRGIVITDSRLPATKNVATMIAGVRDALVVSPRLAKQYALPVVEDLRGRWRTSVEAYRWAFDHLWNRLNHHVLACSYPDHLALRDYLVQHRIFIFWLSGPIDGAKPYANPDAEVHLMEELFARMPVNIPVMSYPWAGKDVGIGEGPGVTLFAEFGKYLVGSINCSNLSVHSGIRVPVFRQKPAPPAPPLDQNRVYVSWIISDGDNLPVLTTSNFPQLWKDKVRGQIPIGWTISPSAALLIPDIVDYYYSTATPNDAFLGAVSGVGYTYADSYALRFRSPDRERIFDGFLAQTASTMRDMDLKSLWIMNATRPELIRRYAERIPTLQALFPDYGRRISGYEDATYPTARNVPVFHAVTGWAEGISREQQMDNLVTQIRAITPVERPAFLHLFVLNWFADLPMLAEIQRRLGDEYVAVRPDHLAQLYRQEIAKREILVRVPPTVVSIEGQSCQFAATLQNVSSRPIDARAEIKAGLSSAVIQPAQAHLKPGDNAVIQVMGFPEGEEIRLEVQGASGARTSLIKLRRVPLSEIGGDLPSDAALRFVRQYSAVELAHRSGREEQDADAVEARVWAAAKGETEPGYVVFGPYAPLPPGRYLALFRLKRTGEGAGVAVTVDTCVGGGSPITATRNLSVSDLPLHQYRSIPLILQHPGGPIETRVLWPGSASVYVDNISLWAIIPK